eukprot:evm.model.scf_79.8 EVM.evm.TU.scf_79.8   scf_79:58230-67507(+)
MASFGVGERFQGSVSSTPGPGAYTPRTKDGRSLALPELKKSGLPSARRSSGGCQTVAAKGTAGPFSARHKRACSHDSSFLGLTPRTTPRGTSHETSNPPHDKNTIAEKKPHSGVRQLNKTRHERKAVQDEPKSQGSKIPPRHIAAVGTQLGWRASGLQSSVDSLCCRVADAEARRVALNSDSLQSSNLPGPQVRLPQIKEHTGSSQALEEAARLERKRVEELEKEMLRQKAALEAANDEIVQLKATLSSRDDVIGQLKDWLSRAQKIQEDCEGQLVEAEGSVLIAPTENNCRSEDSSPAAYASEASTRIEVPEEDMMLVEPSDREGSQELDQKTADADVKAVRIRNIVKTSFAIVSSLAERMGSTEVLAVESLLADAVALSDSLDQSCTRQCTESLSGPLGPADVDSLSTGVLACKGATGQTRAVQQKDCVDAAPDAANEDDLYRIQQEQEMEVLLNECAVLQKDKFQLEQCIRYLAARCQLYQGYCAGEDVTGRRSAHEMRPGSALSTSSCSASAGGKSRKKGGKGTASKRRSAGYKKKRSIPELVMRDLEMERLKDAGIQLEGMEEMKETNPFDDLSWQQSEEGDLYSFSHPPGKNERQILAKVATVCTPAQGNEREESGCGQSFRDV